MAKDKDKNNTDNSNALDSDKLSAIPLKYWNMYRDIEEHGKSIYEAYVINFNAKTTNKNSLYVLASNTWNSEKMQLVKLAAMAMIREQRKRSLEYRIKETENLIELCKQNKQYGAMIAGQKLLLQLEGQLEHKHVIEDKRLETASLLSDLKQSGLSDTAYNDLEKRLGLSKSIN